MENRTIKRIVTGTRQTDGAGVRLVRVVGHRDVSDFDPFLMLDAFDSIDPQDYIKGFPWHPHRGIETVTYLIEGNIAHGDNLGNSGNIEDGCCQWMTAGSGIIHQEMPQPSRRMLGAQLWLNMPAKDKMAPPKYRDIRAESIPKVREDGAVIGVISGEYNGVKGPELGDYVEMLYLDVALEPNVQWQIRTDAAATLFVYIISGSASFQQDGASIQQNRRAVLFEQGEALYVRTGEQGARMLLFAAHPLKEPIAWGGPIVMNTQEELRRAFRELDEGTFIK